MGGGESNEINEKDLVDKIFIDGIIEFCSELVNCCGVKEVPGRGNVHMGEPGEPEG